jgi:hypothetical protein
MMKAGDMRMKVIAFVVSQQQARGVMSVVFSSPGDV